MDEGTKEKTLAADICCSVGLARDLLMLAGGDDEIVRAASKSCTKVESMKAYIIDYRFKKNDLL